MASSRIFSLAITFVALLAITPLAKATCYVAAYGLIEEEDGWKACPGTASKAGGIETCCMPGSECGEDSLCRVPDSDNPGNNAWYQAGCTDSTYTDSVCRNSCVDYTQTYIQWEDSTQLWMCCGDGGCNGTVTDTTFSAVSPDDWKQITGSSSSSSSVTATSTTTSSRKTSSTRTANKQQTPSSADFKPTPTASSGVETASSDSRYRPVGLSPAAKAGVGVGITLAALALIAALIAIFMLRRRRQEQQIINEKIAAGWTPPASSQPSAPSSAPHTEVSGESRWSELPMPAPVYAPVYELASDRFSYKSKKSFRSFRR